MNTSSSIRRRWVSVLVAGSLGLMTLAVVGELPAEEGPKRDAKDVVKLVDAIVNGNKQPKIVERRAGFPKRVALFPEDYDWKEEERVRKAWYQLFQDTSVEVWEEMVRKGEKYDSRYFAVCVMRDIESARVVSVGGIWLMLARSRLETVYQQHMPIDPKKPVPLVVDLGIKNLAEWRKERKDKALYQLQIEVCEKAIVEMNKVEGVSKDMKESARKKIEAEIEKLKKTKRPIFGRDDFFPYWLTLYGRDYATKIREAVKSGSDVDLSIQK
jgi:hypothetical protein